MRKEKSEWICVRGTGHQPLLDHPPLPREDHKDPANKPCFFLPGPRRAKPQVGNEGLVHGCPLSLTGDSVPEDLRAPHIFPHMQKTGLLSRRKGQRARNALLLDELLCTLYDPTWMPCL